VPTRKRRIKVPLSKQTLPPHKPNNSESPGNGRQAERIFEKRKKIKSQRNQRNPPRRRKRFPANRRIPPQQRYGLSRAEVEYLEFVGVEERT
jgi:hypothetical protein